MENIIEFEYDGKKATLRPMLIERQVDGRPFKKRPTILVLPGGGYGFVSDREGEPVARYFNAKGFNCFVLRYTINTGEACFPAPLYQAAKAVEHIRKNADEYNVDENRVFVIGFSAGGHLGFRTVVTATLQKALKSTKRCQDQTVRCFAIPL